jgi:hypothetical protein
MQRQTMSPKITTGTRMLKSTASISLVGEFDRILCFLLCPLESSSNDDLRANEKLFLRIGLRRWMDAQTSID